MATEDATEDLVKAVVAFVVGGSCFLGRGHRKRSRREEERKLGLDIGVAEEGCTADVAVAP